MNSTRSRRVSAALSLVLVFAMVVPQAAFAAPVGPKFTPEVIWQEGFEAPTSPNYTISALTQPTPPAWWGRQTPRVFQGSYGLWAAGTQNRTTLPMTYPELTDGDITFSLDVANYYASNFAFALIQPSLGDRENGALPNSNGGLWVKVYNSGAGKNSSMIPFKMIESTWVTKTVDVSSKSLDNSSSLSRANGQVWMTFRDSTDDSATAQGEGPTIDNVVVSGWHYGQSRDLTATVIGSNVRLSFHKPWSSTAETTDESRMFAYRIWRAPLGSDTYTEVSEPDGLVNGGATPQFLDPLANEGVTYQYVVQPWDTFGGTGYGIPATATISIPSTVPSLTVAVPVANFSVGVAPIDIHGTAADTGTGVSSVKVRINASGKSWNGSAWVAGDYWIDATTDDGFATWSVPWTPDTYARQSLVTVSAKAFDGATPTANTLTKNINAAAPIGVSAMKLAGGAQFTTQTVVPAVLSSTGANWMRRLGDANWVALQSPTNVTLTPSGDGTKTVTYEFSADQSSVIGSATASIILDQTNPIPTITTPAVGFSPTGIGSIGGATAADVSGIDSARVYITSEGKYWNGFGWQSDQIYVPALTANGYADWSISTVPLAPPASNPYGEIDLSVIAQDGAGHVSDPVVRKSANVPDPTALKPKSTAITAEYQKSVSVSGTLTTDYSQSVAGMKVQLQKYSGSTWVNVGTPGTVGANGAVSVGTPSPYPTGKTSYRLRFLGTTALAVSGDTTVVVTPKVYTSTPWSSSKTVYHGKTYSWYSTLKPRHTTGTAKFYFEKKSKTTGLYSAYHTSTSGKAYNYSSTTSRVKASYKIGSSGSYRVRAYFPADSLHAATYSPWLYKTVK
jgi:hypothetical protein